MTSILTSIGIAYSNSIKPLKFKEFLQTFTKIFSSMILKRFQVINTISSSMESKEIYKSSFVIKFVDLLLVVLDSPFISKILNKAGDVNNVNLICVVLAYKLESIWTLSTT